MIATTIAIQQKQVAIFSGNGRLFARKLRFSWCLACTCAPVCEREFSPASIFSLYIRKYNWKVLSHHSWKLLCLYIKHVPLQRQLKLNRQSSTFLNIVKGVHLERSVIWVWRRCIDSNCWFSIYHLNTTLQVTETRFADNIPDRGLAFLTYIQIAVPTANKFLPMFCTSCDYVLASYINCILQTYPTLRNVDTCKLSSIILVLS